MVEVWLPYGVTEVPARIPTENFAGNLIPKEVVNVGDILQLTKHALSSPIGSRPLREILSPDVTVTIQVNVADPRPFHRLLIQAIAEELDAAGIRGEKIRLIATFGVNPPFNDDETRLRLGDTAYAASFHSHKAWDAQALTLVGETSRRIMLHLNKEYLDSDIRIITGDVKFHEYAGYSGGRESVAFDLSGLSTLARIHSFLPLGESRPGVLDGNLVHQEISEIERMAPPTFTINVVRGANGDPINVIAGESVKVFDESVKVVNTLFTPSIPEQVNVVIASAGGDPYDTTLSDVMGTVENSMSIIAPGGVLILVAECRKGYGSEGFHKWMKAQRDKKSIEKMLQREWEYGAEKAFILRRAQQSTRIILVSAIPDLYTVETYGIRAAPTVSSAVDLALRIVGRKAKVAAIPYARITRPQSPS